MELSFVTHTHNVNGTDEFHKLAVARDTKKKTELISKKKSSSSSRLFNTSISFAVSFFHFNSMHQLHMLYPFFSVF